MAALLDTLLTTSPAVASTAADWFAATAAARTAFPTTIERALVGGALADRVAFAFAAGYTEALRYLVPSLDGIAALCASEADGNHPRAIKTRLDGTRLTGHKRWSTGASDSDHACSVGGPRAEARA
jgi:acyl-CoA dehydrogenase